MGPHPLDEARTYLLCRDGAAVAFDPEPEILEEVLLLLELHGTEPMAILETRPAAAADAASPGYLLARERGWFWVGPVRAWSTGGAVLRILDRLLLDLSPEASEEDIARGRRLPWVDLDLSPFTVRAAPVPGEPGRVTYRVRGKDLSTSEWLDQGMALLGSHEGR